MEDVDIVLIAGDLFDANQQPWMNVDLVVEKLNISSICSVLDLSAGT